MKLATSYFYQIRHFTPNLIPVSVCLSDPNWYRPPQGQEYYIDKRGIICGLRYEPLIVQNMISPCIGAEEICAMRLWENYECPFLSEYKQALYSFVDKEKTLKAFEYCANKFKRPFDDEEPIIVLMVYETPDNPCSERKALQEFFNCKELEYPIK